MVSIRNRIIAHVTFWVFSNTISFFIWSLPNYKEGYLESFLWHIAGSYSSNIVYFYINYFILVPLFLARKRYGSFAFLTLISCVVHIIGCTYFWNDHFSWDIIFSRSAGPMTYECLFYGIISTGFRMFELWDKSEEHKNQLEKELKEAELLFLQSQMSPHFLFNTLNNIYGLSLNGSPQTAKSVSELKNLMRYFEHFERGEKIQLVKELHYLNDFIEINRLRNPVIVKQSIEVSEAQKEMFIEPMLLLPFIENAFKHGDLNQAIEINLSVKENSLYFSVVNEVNVGKRKDSTGGIGIRNIRRRLELLFPEKHQLAIKSEKGYHVSQMSLELQ